MVSHCMKRTSTLFLQVVIVLVGLSVLVFMLWEPHLEGVNANATTLAEIYFDDPFLAYVYAASSAFFVALYQAFKVVGYARRSKVLSQAAVKAIRTIKYCALVLVACIAGAEAYLFTVMRGKDDIAGGTMAGFIMLVIFAIVAAVASWTERFLQNRVQGKSEHGVTA